MTRPIRQGAFYEANGFRFNANQFESNADFVEGSLVLNDVSYFGSTPVFSDASGVSLTEDDCSLTCDGRMLSATMIKGHWVDYSDPALWTEETAQKFAVTLYLNHDASVDSWIGAATNPRLSTKGILGVDATFKIDKKRDMVLTQGAICAGLKHVPVTVKSFSVGINHTLKRSHTFEDPWEFWEKLGTEVDGSVVCFKVTSIDRIRECSLVYAGADPNAKAYGLLEVNEIDYRDKFEKLIAEYGIKHAASAASQLGDRQMPISPLLAKALKDITGIEYSETNEVTVIPALYACKSSADGAVALAEKHEKTSKDLAEFQKTERDRLMKLGKETNKNLNDDMDAWANSLTIDQLSYHVNNARPMGPVDVKPAPESAHKKGQLMTPSMPNGLTHGDVELMSARFGIPIADVYKNVKG